MKTFSFQGFFVNADVVVDDDDDDDDDDNEHFYSLRHFNK